MAIRDPHESEDRPRENVAARLESRDNRLEGTRNLLVTLLHAAFVFVFISEFSPLFLEHDFERLFRSNPVFLAQILIIILTGSVGIVWFWIAVFRRVTGLNFAGKRSAWLMPRYFYAAFFVLFLGSWIFATYEMWDLPWFAIQLIACATVLFQTWKILVRIRRQQSSKLLRAGYSLTMVLLAVEATVVLLSR